LLDALQLGLRKKMNFGRSHPVFYSVRQQNRMSPYRGIRRFNAGLTSALRRHSLDSAFLTSRERD
jgi:hypothetical protein